MMRVPALQYPDFRLLWASSFFKTMGFSADQVALGWLVLEITNDPLWVGLAYGLRAGPGFFLGIIAGAIADRFDRRSLLPGLSLGFAALSAVLGLLVWADALEVWHLLLVAVLVGILNPLNQTTQQSFAYDIVGGQGALNGLSFMGLSQRLGGAVGALAVGWVIMPFGAHVAYFLMGAAYVLGAAVLIFVRSSGQAAPERHNPVMANLKEYRKFALHNPTFLMVVGLTGVVEMVGFSYQALLPSLARDVLRVGPGGLGVMSAVRSAGGIGGIIFLSAAGEVKKKGLMLLYVLLGMGASLFVMGLAPSYAVFLLVLVAVSAAGTLSDILTQTLVQLAVPNDLRGRAMGSWILAIGMGPVGQMQIGAVAAALSISTALMINGAALMALAVAVLAFSSRLRRL
jgi:MFS family permease